MKRFLVLAVSVLAAAARAENVRLVVETAPASEAWHGGQATPYVARLTGLGRTTARVDCWGAEMTRAQVVRDGLPSPLFVDRPPSTIPGPQEVSCTARRGDVTVAHWRGVLAWPEMTLPDGRITISTSPCETTWCVEVEIDRSHPGLVGAEQVVACTLRNASPDPQLASVAPWSRGAIKTKAAQVRIQLAPDAPGATRLECTLDQNGFFADADRSNNTVTATVANPAPKSAARIRFLEAGHARRHPGCGTCSTIVPGDTFFTAHVRNEGRALPGLGLVCSVEGTSVTLVGALPSIAPGETREVTVSASNDLAGVRTLTGARQTRCRAVSWDEAASPSAGTWSGVVEFP